MTKVRAPLRHLPDHPVPPSGEVGDVHRGAPVPVGRHGLFQVEADQGLADRGRETFCIIFASYLIVPKSIDA